MQVGGLWPEHNGERNNHRKGHTARLATPRAAIGFLQLPPRAPEHRWLDSWAGIGLIAVGLHRQGWDLQLTQSGDGKWRATFYVTAVAHSIVGGTAQEPPPWRAVQRAAWHALRRRVVAPQ